MTMHDLYTLLAAEHSAQTISWWQETWTILKSPAHWASEGVIEIGLGAVGWHVLAKLVHKGKHLIVKSVKRSLKGLTRIVKRDKLSA